MSYKATIVGGARDGEEVEYGNQFLLIRHLLLGTIAIDKVQALKAWDEIEASIQRRGIDTGPVAEIEPGPLKVWLESDRCCYQLPTDAAPLPMHALQLELHQPNARDILELLNKVAFQAWKQGPNFKLVLHLMRKPTALSNEPDA